MADHYEVVSNAPGFGSRFLNSIKGIFVGIVFFIAAFGLLWWGERRQNLAEFVKKATFVYSTQAATVAPGTLIKTEGRIRSDESVNDDKYLNPGTQKILSLSRTVEMYAWKEEKKTEKRGDKDVTTYDYRKDWTRSPSDSSRFYDPAGHANPKMAEDSQSWQVKTATIGSLEIKATDADFHGGQDLQVSETFLKTDPARSLGSGAIYIAQGPVPTSGPRKPASSPEVGDLRLTYSYFPADVEGSAVGDWDGKRIAPHGYGAANSYLGVFGGTLEAFQKRLQSEHDLMTWIIRIASFLMLWIGLNMILGPILTIMDSIPIVGGAGRFVISLFTGAVAFVLWLLTILLANLWLALVIVGVLVFGLMVYAKLKKRSVS